MFKYFSFNLDTRIHTSPKRADMAARLGPKGVVWLWKERQAR